MEKLFDLKTAAEFVFSQPSDDSMYFILIKKYIEIKRGKIEDHGVFAFKNYKVDANG